MWVGAPVGPIRITGSPAFSMAHRSEEPTGEGREERPGRGVVRWGPSSEHARHDGITLARRTERFDDVAEIGRMLVAEEAEEAPVGETREQHLRALGLRDRMLRLERLSVLAAGLEVLAVEREMRGVLA